MFVGDWTMRSGWKGNRGGVDGTISGLTALVIMPDVSWEERTELTRVVGEAVRLIEEDQWCSENLRSNFGFVVIDGSGAEGFVPSEPALYLARESVEAGGPQHVALSLVFVRRYLDLVAEDFARTARATADRQVECYSAQVEFARGNADPEVSLKWIYQNKAVDSIVLQLQDVYPDKPLIGRRWRDRATGMAWRVIDAIYHGPVRRLDLRLSADRPSTMAGAIRIVDCMAEDESGAQRFLDATQQALELVESYDPRRYARILREISVVVNRSSKGRFHHYMRTKRACRVDFEQLTHLGKGRSWEWIVARYAAALVNLSTSGRCFSFDVFYRDIPGLRIERLCRSEEIRFVRRLPPDSYGGGQLVPEFHERRWRARTWRAALRAQMHSIVSGFKSTNDLGS